MKLSVGFDLSDEQFEYCWNMASRSAGFTYLRENPNKSWSLEEKKDCVRKYVNWLLLSRLPVFDIPSGYSNVFDYYQK